MPLHKFFDSCEQKLERVCRKSGDIKKLRLLLQRNPAVNVNMLTFDRKMSNGSLLHIAASSDFPEVVEVLIMEGNANPDVKTTDTGNTPLHVAAWMGHVEVAKALTSPKVLLDKHTVDINAVNAEGFTPLAYCCWAGMLDMCQVRVRRLESYIYTLFVP